MNWWYKRNKQRKKTPANLAEVEIDRLYHVEVPQDGMRADAFIQARNPWYSQANVALAFAENRVTMHGSALPPAFILHQGDTVTLILPPPEEDITEMKRIPYDIVHEDEGMLVVSKPPHLIVHPTGGYRYTTLLNALHARYRSDDPARDVVPRLVNRIDKETSGLVLLGKTASMTGALGRAFEQRDVEKDYLALVEGNVEEDHQVIDLPIGEDTTSEKEIVRAVNHETGQPSRTEVLVEERLLGRFTLVRCRLHTGRQHQIRVHMQAIGHPLVCDHHYGLRDELLQSDLADPPPAPTRGDSPYGYREGDSDADVTDRIRAVDTAKRHEYEALCRGEVVPRPNGDRLWLGRCALHSHRVKLVHPKSGEVLELIAPLPRDIAGALAAMREKASQT